MSSNIKKEKTTEPPLKKSKLVATDSDHKRKRSAPDSPDHDDQTASSGHEEHVADDDEQSTSKGGTKRPSGSGVRSGARGFTREEDERLIDAILKHGGAWTKVAEELGNGRLKGTCFSRFQVLKKKMLQ
ncbi:hypothetical protein BC938DRAFT_477060 [Jimgerdemannia flammicorona]|uniref:Uncharacterized protein n=1 Tax=Jimgerdemannia flammicorona TaxID=994334 RepID=A0A433QPS8_9FUNG|nr:hypothetical protein BC938DRAFT_477060 [Jimgerdemannia flammicorona]